MNALTTFTDAAALDLTGAELGVLLVANQFGNRVERGQYRREIPRLIELGLGHFGRNYSDRFFLTEAGKAIARSYK